MRKLLLASVLALVPFVAFADPHGGAIAGNVTGTASISVGGISAGQSTQAISGTMGNGFSMNSAAAGNAATINTNGYAVAGPGKASTGSNTTETQTGGVTTKSVGMGWQRGGASGNEGTTVLGGSTAAAGNLNGFVAVQPGKNHRPD